MTNRQARHATAVLVHGGFLGPWIWADTVRLLEARGVRPVTVDLPSSQDSSDRLPGLHDDAEAVRDALNGCADAVLCGHSYAGAVISEAAAGPQTRATGTQTSRSAGQVGVAQFYLPAADEECAEVDDQ